MLTGLHAERVLHFPKVAGHGGEVGVGVGQNKPPRENSVLQEQTLAEEGGRGRDKDACHNPEGQTTAEARARGFDVKLEPSCGSPVKERCHRGGGEGQSQWRG